MGKTHPTAPQTLFLVNRGIVPPPTRLSCTRLISYIKEGNGSIGKTESERIAITISAQRKWHDRKVQYRYDDRVGIIQYLIFRTVREVSFLAEANVLGQEESRGMQPFNLFVRWGNGMTSCVDSSSVKLIE